MIGTTVSHYKILGKLGEGGMGVVYQAKDTRLERMVAVKFLAPHVLKSEEAKTRFIREAKAAAALDHPNVCTIHEIDEAGAQTFIVMAYVDGESLRDKIAHRPLSLDEAVDIAGQVAQGLLAAHQKHVVHRDIKCANIMVTPEKQVRILDFGLAMLGDREHLTKAGTTLGTPAYMSPEQVRAQQVDHRTDIWSIGVVLYEMITGKLPFQGDAEVAVAVSVLQEKQQSLSSSRTGVPMQLERVVAKCLAKDPAGRYQCVDELLVDLRALKRSLESGQAGRPSSGTRDATAPSIAVLPFENRSHDEEDEYFSDGITEDIISALGKVEGLRVVPRRSAYQLKEKRPPLSEVGKELKAGYIVEGSVRRSRNRVRINVELVEVAGGFQLWAERYDRVMEDVFDVQDEISQAIVEKLKIKLVGEQKEQRARRYTENIEAYNLCLKGRFYWYQRTPEALQKAMAYFQQALGEDPNYALAHAGAADCHAALSFYAVLPPKQGMPTAKAAALRALEIDPDLAAAHATLGYIASVYHWNWSEAGREFRRAIELDPSYATVQFYLCVLYWTPIGRLDEGYAAWRRAGILDPITPLLNLGPGFILLHQRNYQRAIEELNKLLELSPDFPWTHHLLGRAYLQMGMHDQALAEFKWKGPLMFHEGHLGYAYAVTGQPGKARNLIEELRGGSRPQYLTAYQIAMIYVGLGDKDQSFKWLERAFEQRAGQLVWLKVTPEFEPLRSDPRFANLLRRMNLEDAATVTGFASDGEPR